MDAMELIRAIEMMVLMRINGTNGCNGIDQSNLNDGIDEN